MEKPARQAFEDSIRPFLEEHYRKVPRKVQNLRTVSDLGNTLHSGRPRHMPADRLLRRLITSHVEKSIMTSFGHAVFETAALYALTYFNPDVRHCERLERRKGKIRCDIRIDRYRPLGAGLLELKSGSNTFNAGALEESKNSADGTVRNWFQGQEGRDRWDIQTGNEPEAPPEFWLICFECHKTNSQYHEEVRHVMVQGNPKTYIWRNAFGQMGWCLLTKDPEFYRYWPQLCDRIAQKLDVDAQLPQLEEEAVKRILAHAQRSNLVRPDGHFDWDALAQFKNEYTGPTPSDDLSYQGNIVLPPRKRTLIEELFRVR